MSKPRYRWWGFVRRMIRDYRGLKIEYNDLHSQSVTAGGSGLPRGGGNHRAVEAIATKKLPKDDQDAYDAVTKAVELTRVMPEGERRISLIRYVYWCEKQHSVRDAAGQMNISDITAKRWHADFVRLTGKCYGFSLKDDTTEPKNCDTMAE